MFEIIYKFLFFFIILQGNGLIFSIYINNKSSFKNYNIFENGIYGLVVTGFLSQFLIFFFL
jgi:hypothetical protein